MTEDQSHDVYRVLQTESPVFFTALNLFGLQIGAVHTELDLGIGEPPGEERNRRPEPRGSGPAGEKRGRRVRRGRIERLGAVLEPVELRGAQLELGGGQRFVEVLLGTRADDRQHVVGLVEDVRERDCCG